MALIRKKMSAILSNRAVIVCEEKDKEACLAFFISLLNLIQIKNPEGYQMKTSDGLTTIFYHWTKLKPKDYLIQDKIFGNLNSLYKKIKVKNFLVDFSVMPSAPHFYPSDSSKDIVMRYSKALQSNMFGNIGGKGISGGHYVGSLLGTKDKYMSENNPYYDSDRATERSGKMRGDSLVKTGALLDETYVDFIKALFLSISEKGV